MRSSRHGNGAIFWLARAVTVLALSARTAPAQTTVRGVEVVLVGTIGREASLPARIETWFDPRDFRVSVRTAPVLDIHRVLDAEPGPLTRVWVTSPAPRKVRFYFATTSEKAATTVYLLRELHVDHGIDEMAAERIAQVCFLSTVALVEGQAETLRAELEASLRTEPSAGDPSSPVPSAVSARETPLAERTDDAGPLGAQRPPLARDSLPPHEPSPAKPTRRSGTRSPFGFGVGYGAGLRGDEGLSHGPRTRFAVRFPTLGVAAIVQGHLPVRADFGSFVLRWYGVALHTGLEARHDAGDFLLAMLVGPGLDIVHYAPDAVDEDVRAAPSATEARPLLGLSTSIEFGPPTPRVAIIAELAVGLTRTHYDIVRGSDRQVVAKVWPVLPTWALELRF